MSKPKPSDEPAFEEAMERLEEIVASMDGEQLPLDEMVKSYEEGVRLLKLCRGKIEGARARVERIHASLDASEPAELTAFDTEDEEEAPAPTAKTRRSAVKPKASDDESEDDEIRLF